MKEEQVSLLSDEEMPQTDEPKAVKPRINNLQENLIYLMELKGVSLAEIQKETMIPWGTLFSWYKADVNCQMLDINVKEIASFFDITIDELAFGNLREEGFEN